MKFFAFLILLCNLLSGQNKTVLIDDFEDLSKWTIYKSDGAELKFSSVKGVNGNCIKIDYNFKYGTGYCGIQRKLDLNLPRDYRFSFLLKASSPNNNFEIKFLDETKENVWWMNNRNFEFPSDWEKFLVRKRNIQFAWGPAQNKDLNHISYIEFTIASFTGGSGTIYLDELTFEEIVDTIQSELKIFPTELKVLLDNDEKSSFLTAKKEFSFTVDFGKLFEPGGLKIIWGDNSRKNLTLFESSDSINWTKVLEVNGISKRFSYFQFKNVETRFLKFIISSQRSFKINEIKFFDYQFSESSNNIFFDWANSNYSKFLPEYFSRKASYWTVTGMIDDDKEALIDINGMIEVDKNSFSILPFIEKENKIFAYKDFSIQLKLLDDYLPFPVVEWNSKDIKLKIQTFSWGIPFKSNKLFIEYELINPSRKKVNGKIHFALLPFQVNPYYQFLNNPGGVSKIDSIKVVNNGFIINGNRLSYNFTELSKHRFDFFRNDVISALVEKNFDSENYSDNQDGLNSGLISFTYRLTPGDTLKLRFIYDYYQSFNSTPDKKEFDEYFEQEKTKYLNFWKSILSKTEITGSEQIEKLFKIVKSNLAYILINKDGYGIQPGSRSYERSWIRDGSLTSTALLRFGFNYEVKNFIRWYGKHIYENGKVPCVVDKRGPDPVDEHDSHGEFLYLLYTYFEFTKDTSLLREYFPVIKKIVHHIDSLVHLRKSKEYLSDSLSPFYGLMPESISHEGYSAKPMHSFWDNFFTLRGLNDATNISFILNEQESYNEFQKIKTDFQTNLSNSIIKTIKKHKIDYIPGCVELGDYDPTSTSIAYFPCNISYILSEFELKNTFDKYFDFIFQRESQNDFVNFTPYEIRNINSFLFQGQKERAFKLLNFMLKYQRPANWNHWAEVVWRDSSTPEFIGDMPHTWVGSDFINAFRNMFLYEDEIDSSFKLLMGFSESFLNHQNYFELKNLQSISGPLNMKIKKVKENQIDIELNGELTLNGWKIYIYNPLDRPVNKVLVNGKETNQFDNNRIEVTEFPAIITIKGQ